MPPFAPDSMQGGPVGMVGWKKSSSRRAGIFPPSLTLVGKEQTGMQEFEILHLRSRSCLINVSSMISKCL